MKFQTRLLHGKAVDTYLTHPAFTAFNTNGIWVGKFETGYDGATSTTAAQVNSNEIASKELNRILKESKNVEKKLNKEYRSIASKSLLKQRLVQLYVSGFYNDKQMRVRSIYS